MTQDNFFINIPEKQKSFFKQRFCLTNKDFPACFYPYQMFINIVCGDGVCLKTGFAAMVYKSVELKYTHQGHNRIIAQINSMADDIGNLEYYELGENLAFVLWSYKKAQEIIDEIFAERETFALLTELGIKVE